MFDLPSQQWCPVSSGWCLPLSKNTEEASLESWFRRFAAIRSELFSSNCAVVWALICDSVISPSSLIDTNWASTDSSPLFYLASLIFFTSRSSPTVCFTCTRYIIHQAGPIISVSFGKQIAESNTLSTTCSSNLMSAIRRMNEIKFLFSFRALKRVFSYRPF